MKVKVLKRNSKKEQVKPKLLTSSYVKQLNQKISYNIIQIEKRRDLGKGELVLKRTKI